MKKFIGFFCFVFIGMLFISCNSKKSPHVEDYTVYETSSKNVPVVYFIREITPESLVKVYKAMGWTPKGNVGVKISTGEPPASNYLRPELIGNLVKDELHGTIVECNTAYGGGRSSVLRHKQVVKDHGFLEIADFDLLDEEGYMEIPIVGGENIDVDYVGSHFANYDSYLVLSHFKGHQMAGFGGAIKNLSIGFASGQPSKVSGKAWIHTAGNSKISYMGGKQLPFLESMAEAAKGVCDYMQNESGIAFVNVLNRLSVDCDCNGFPAEPDMHDIGILASTDPLAIDQASIDLVFLAEDAKSLVKRIDSLEGRHVLEHAEKIGLGQGSRKYRLVEIK